MIHWFLCFLIYSFIGWCCETVYCSIGSRHFVNRGFLSGPLCPVYGFGALAVILLLEPVKNSLPLVFLLGMVVASALEYVTAWLLEVLFHAKWWDYSTYRFNIHGRVCLRNSLMFGGLAVIAVMGAQPLVDQILALVPFVAQAVIAAALAVCMTCDCVLTVRSILSLNGRLQELQTVAEELYQRGQEYLEQLEAQLSQGIQERRELSRENLRERLEEAKMRAQAQGWQLSASRQEVIDRLEQRRAELLARNGRIHRRLLEAFPNLRSQRYPTALERLRQELEQRKKK